VHDCREAIEIADGGVSKFDGRLDPVVDHPDSLDGITGAQYEYRHEQLETVKPEHMLTSMNTVNQISLTQPSVQHYLTNPHHNSKDHPACKTGFEYHPMAQLCDLDCPKEQT